MNCPCCHDKLPLIKRLLNEHFCSKMCAERYVDEMEQQMVVRLAAFREREQNEIEPIVVNGNGVAAFTAVPAWSLMLASSRATW